jgi:MFS family permease
MHLVKFSALFRRIGRYCLAAFGIDGAFYLTLTGVPWKAISLGATPMTLGLLPAVWSVIYILGCGMFGRLSDRLAAEGMTRTGTLVLAGAVVVIAITDRLWGLFLGMAMAAVGLSLFWPALQASVALAGKRHSLDSDLGWFNISWSAGKAVGFLTGGLLLAGFGFRALFGVSLGLILLVSAALQATRPRSEPGSEEPVAIEGDGAGRESQAAAAAAAVPMHRRHGFLIMAWIANGASYGASATLNYHYPRLLGDSGLGAGLFGTFLGLVYLSQTATFAILRKTNAWHYRRAPLYAVQIGFAALMFVLPAVHVPAIALLLAPLAGVGLGLAYYSSIYYSLHAAARPGRNTGFHEAVIGSGVLLVPPIGGWLASEWGENSLPFMFCGSVLLLAIVAEDLMARKWGFRSRERWFPIS